MAGLSHRAWIFIGAAIVFAAAALLFVGTSQRQARMQLPSGGEVTLVKVTYGRDHRFVPGNFWQRIIGSIASTNLAQKFGVKIDRHQSASDELRVWLEIRDPWVTNMAVIGINMLDANGLESGRSYINRRVTVSPVQRFDCFPVLNFPRRSKEFGIRVYRLDRTEWMPTGEVVVENPVRKRQFATWTREPLPTVRTDGNESFLLTRFNTGLFATGLVTRIENSWTEINFEQPAGAYQSGLWIPERVEVWDATGNRIDDRGPQGRIIKQTDKQYTSTRIDGGVYLRGALWIDEPAWRIRLELLQDRKANFRAENLWSLTNLPLSGLSDQLPAIQTQIQNVRLKLKALNANEIRFDFFPPTNTFHLTVVRAFDQRGSNVVCLPARGGRNERVFDLRLRRGAERINCTFAVHRQHVVEFAAKPTLLRTNVAYWARP